MRALPMRTDELEIVERGHDTGAHVFEVFGQTVHLDRRRHERNSLRLTLRSRTPEISRLTVIPLLYTCITGLNF